MTISGGVDAVSKKASKKLSHRSCGSIDYDRNGLFRQRIPYSPLDSTRRGWGLLKRTYALTPPSSSYSRFLRTIRPRRSMLIATVVLFSILELRKPSLIAEVLPERTHRLSDEEFEEIVSNLEPSRLLSLQPPSEITNLLPIRHADGRERKAPENHKEPFVFTAVGIPSKGSETNRSQTLLFLYSQGTVSSAASGSDAFHLNVTSCLVGPDPYPVIYNANGVYTCLITRQMNYGENLSLLVSPRLETGQGSTLEMQQQMKRLEGALQIEDELFVIESDVAWVGQMEEPEASSEGRYQVCMMTQEKTFTEYIPEWVAYHRRLGVDYIYIYDNRSPKNLSDTYKSVPDVEVVYWPWARSQIQAQNHFLLTGRRRCQWAILIDVDEYVMLRPRWPLSSEQPLKKFLRLKREGQDFSQIRVTSVALGSSGNIYRPRGPMVDSYWHSANIQDNLTKPILWLGHSLPDSTVHYVSMAGGYYTHTTESALDTPETTEIALCHMKYRSWEDYVLKGRGGRNSFRVEAWRRAFNWSIHSPGKNHMTIRNARTFVEFRKLWKRFMLYDVRPPALAPANEAELRYKRVGREGYVWKRRRGLGNSTLINALIEKEKCFRQLAEWESRKRDRLAQMGITVEF